MSRVIQQEDLKLLLQRSLNYKLKIEILNSNDEVMTTLDGVTESSGDMNSDSDVRTTWQFTIVPTALQGISINENSFLWINKRIRVYIGIQDLRTLEYKWYKQGCFYYTNTSGTYDAMNNQLSVSVSDFMISLDGTKNGQVGALKTIFPAYKQDDTTGQVKVHYKIRDQVVEVVTQMSRIKDYYIEEIGEYYGLPQYNDDYESYRTKYPLWNATPYDLEFSCGCSISSILDKFKELYPNYEIGFDENGLFFFRMIPSGKNDPVIFLNDFLQKIMLADGGESRTTDMIKVRNICEVWGKVIEADFYTEVCTYYNKLYTATVTDYTEYKTGDKIAIKLPSTNPANSTLIINGLEVVDIYDENTNAPLAANQIEANTIYVFKIKKEYNNGYETTHAFLLGHWQAHGLNVLTDGTTGDNYTFSDNTVLPQFSKEYFQKIYNCESVELTVLPESPFTVQKIGEIPDIKHDGEYENITSDSLALSRAKYENWKNCRLTDEITINTVLIPFIGTSIKVSYKPSDSDVENQYIVKSVHHDFTNCTSSISMYRFYPLYDN